MLPGTFESLSPHDVAPEHAQDEPRGRPHFGVLGELDGVVAGEADDFAVVELEDERCFGNGGIGHGTADNRRERGPQLLPRWTRGPAT